MRRTLKALLRSHHYIIENRQDAIQTLIKWLPQPIDIAEHSYDAELRTGLNRDGTMTDAEIEAIIERVGEKKRPAGRSAGFLVRARGAEGAGTAIARSNGVMEYWKGWLEFRTNPLLELHHSKSRSVVSIRVVVFAQLGGSDNLRGDVMAAVHHVQVHVAVKTFQRMFDE